MIVRTEKDLQYAANRIYLAQNWIVIPKLPFCYQIDLKEVFDDITPIKFVFLCKLYNYILWWNTFLHFQVKNEMYYKENTKVWHHQGLLPSQNASFRMTTLDIDIFTMEWTILILFAASFLLCYTTHYRLTPHLL